MRERLLGDCEGDSTQTSMARRKGPPMADFLGTASNASLWRGYDYFKEGDRVSRPERQTDGTYEAQVRGSDEQIYHVRIDIAHPKRSVCDCPHAAGKHLVCKHMIAVFFTQFPSMEDELMRRVKEEEEAEQRFREERDADIRRRVWAMKKDELREQLLWRMLDEASRNDRWW